MSSSDDWIDIGNVAAPPGTYKSVGATPAAEATNRQGPDPGTSAKTFLEWTFGGGKGGGRPLASASASDSYDSPDSAALPELEPRIRSTDAWSPHAFRLAGPKADDCRHLLRRSCDLDFERRGCDPGRLFHDLLRHAESAASAADPTATIEKCVLTYRIRVKTVDFAARLQIFDCGNDCGSDCGSDCVSASFRVELQRDRGDRWAFYDFCTRLVAKMKVD